MVFEICLMVGRKPISKEVGLTQYTPMPFYKLTYEAFYPRGTPKQNKGVRISKRRFLYVHEFTNKKKEKKFKHVSIDLFVSQENLENTIKNLTTNGAKNIKKIQFQLPLPKYCPECETSGTVNVKLDDRYNTKNHKVRIHYNHKDKSKHYVATYDLDTESLSPRGKTSKKEAIDIRKFYLGYWVKKFGTPKNGITTLEFD